jgi:hypothetical protein
MRRQGAEHAKPSATGDISENGRSFLGTPLMRTGQLRRKTATVHDMVALTGWCRRHARI